MYEVDKLHRDDLHDKEQAPVEVPEASSADLAPQAPDMPELGGGTSGLLGARGSGDKVDEAEMAADQKKQDMAELERLKGLPAGHPDLESAKKDEAADSKVPEGPGLTDAAKTDASMMSPQEELQGEAEVGDDPSAPAMGEAPGAGAVPEMVDVAATIQGQGAADAGASVAATAKSNYDAAQAANEEAKAEPVQPPTGGVEGPAAAEVPAEPSASPDESKIVEAQPEAGDVTTPEAPTQAADAAVDTSDPVAEVQSEPEPEIIPEVSEEQVAAESAAADIPAEPEVEAAPDVDAVAEAPELSVAEAQVSETETPSIEVQTVEAEGPAGGDAPVELAAADLQVQGDVPSEPVAIQEEAPADGAALADPAGSGVETTSDSMPTDAGSGSVETGALGAEDGQAATAMPGPLASAAPVVEAVQDLDTNVADLKVNASEEMPAPGGDKANTPTESGQQVAIENNAGREAQAEGAIPSQDNESAEPGLADDVANQVGGAKAAEGAGLEVFGANAIGADERATQSPGAEEPGVVAAIEELAANAKPELLNELGDAGAQEAIDKAEQIKVDVDATAQALEGQVAELDQHTDSFKKRAKDLESFRANPGERTRDLLGEGEEVESNLRNKAEASLGESLGDVKIHTGEGAREIADAIDATAFTQNEDIILGEADEFTQEKKEQVILEELVHVKQMAGGKGGRSGVSSVADKAEKGAKAAAQRIQDGARGVSIQHDDERRAIYRNESTSEGGSGATFPEHVTVSLGGRSVTINLPADQPVEASKLVTLPSMSVPGLELSRNATLFFNTTTGRFTGGRTSGTIGVGETLSSDSRDIRIDSTGNMTGTFQDADLKVGELIDAHIDASVGAKGVTAQGNIGVADLKGDKLSQWLKGGQLAVSVNPQGTTTASGNLDMEVSPFQQGTLAAHIEDNQLAGILSINQTANIDLGPSAKLGTGKLSGILTESRSLEIEGQLALTVIPLPEGKGSANISWEGESQKISGNATFAFEGENRVNNTTFSASKLTGSIAESVLNRLDGSGHAVYDNLFEGDWAGGGITLQERQADYTLQGGLKEEIDRSPVKVWGGALTIQVAQNELQSTSGNTEFSLADFMTGTAVLEAGTSRDNINATATAKLNSPKVFDELKLSEGAAVVKVRGTDVQIVSGHVDMDFRNGVAVGKLDLAASERWDQLSGHGQANIRAGEVWGGLAIKKGHVDIDVRNNRLTTARGHAKFETKNEFGGNLSFDATDNFAVLSGTAQAWLTKTRTIGNVSTVADAEKQFTAKIENSELTQFKGPIQWTHEKFKGQVNVTSWLTHLNQLTGTGPTDVKAPFAIGTLTGSNLTAQPGSKLTGHFNSGLFNGVSGTVNWKWHQWLAGTASIDTPSPSIDVGHLSGNLAAGVIAPHVLNSKISLAPSPLGSLTVKLTDGSPSHYKGKVNFTYRDFAKGTVNVQGEMLDFNSLAGDSSLTVYANKAISAQKGMVLNEGGKLAVTVQDTDIRDFTGPASFTFGEWMKGTVQAEAGSSFDQGITGLGTGTLLKTPTPQEGKKVRMTNGGTAKVQFNVGVEPIAFESGSVLSWKYDEGDWLEGVMTMSQQQPFGRITGNSPAIVMNEKLLPGSNPALSLLPSEGLTVKFNANTVANFKGAVDARLDEWAKGRLTIDGTAAPNIFNGSLVGPLAGIKRVEGTQLSFIEGGAATIKVNQNRATKISGTIPFMFGEGDWLQGIANVETPSALRSISAPFDQGQVRASGKDFGGGWKLHPGGTINGQINNNDIQKIAGAVNFGYSEAGKEWVKGALTVSEPQSPGAMSGEFVGGIAAEKLSGSLKLMPGGGLTGTVASNAVTKIAGDINFQYGEWLEGIINVETPSAVGQLSANGIANVIKKHHAQGNAYFVPYGSQTFDVKVENGQVTKLSNGVTFQISDWMKGIATTGDQTPSKIVGHGPGEIIGEKTYGLPQGKVYIHPGALTKAEVTSNGDGQFSGPVQAEYGDRGNARILHVGIGGNATEATATSFKGKIVGGLMDQMENGPEMNLTSGGNVTVDLSNGSSPTISGSFQFGWGAPSKSVIVGTVNPTPMTDIGQMTGPIPKATIAKEQSNDAGFKVLTGGSVYGTLVSPTDVKLEGGTFGYQFKDFLEGTITINGTLNMNEGINADGGATGNLTRDLEFAPNFKLLQGSGGEFYFENNNLTKLWGAFGFTMGEEIEGQILIEQGNSNLDNVYGSAQAHLTKNIPISSGQITLTEGSQFQLEVSGNQWSDVSGNIGFTYEDDVKGHVAVQPGSTLHNLTGEAQASLIKRRPVDGSSLVIEPGGSLTALMESNTIADVRGNVNWSYGDLGWIKGTIEAQTGSLDHVSGAVKGSVAVEKFIGGGKVRIREGGSFSANFDGAKMSGFEGELSIVYDEWIEGTAKISGGGLDNLNGEVFATTKFRKQLGQNAFLKPDAALIATFANNKLTGFAGSAGWQYEEWLDGTVEIDAGSTLESLSGVGTASIRERKQLGAKTQLERGGSFKAAFAGSTFKGIGGQVGFIYDEWLGGNIEVPAYSKLTSLDGKATVSVRHNKIVNGELELQAGGSLSTTLAGGDIKQVQGSVNWRYGTWIGGNVTLDPSPLEALKGSAEATILQDKPVGDGGFVLRPGGSISIGFDAGKNIAQQTFMGDVAWAYQEWLEGSVTVGAGASFDGIQGEATARLADDKDVGNGLVLKSGGSLNVGVKNTAPVTFGGDVLWHYEDWLAGTLTVNDGSTLTNISGEATAHLRKEKPLGDGQFKLQSGGNAALKFADRKPTHVSGNINFAYKDFVEGGLSIEEGSTFKTMTGEGSARITSDQNVGTQGFKVRGGTQATILFENNQFYGFIGELRWGYKDFVEGSIVVEKTKLENISGEASATIVKPQTLPGDKFKVLTGGNAKVTVKQGALTGWGGSVRVQYEDWLQGALKIASPGPLSSISGDVKGTLLIPKKIGEKVNIEEGAYLQAKFSGPQLTSFSGKGRFTYEDFLVGAAVIDESSTLTNINGSIQAQLLKDYNPGGGKFTLRQGGGLKAEIKNNSLGSISGRANWKYMGDKAKVAGSITLEPSTLKSINGNAKAHLLSEIQAPNDVKILKGGELSLSVQNSKPGSFGGRVNWQYSNWLKGNVQVATGTGFDGPYSGSAKATIIKAQTRGKAKFLKGGHMTLAFDSAAGVENSTFTGRVGVDYNDDVRVQGFINLEQATLKQLNGSAEMTLMRGADVGSSGVKILRGSRVDVDFANNSITGFDGVARYRYDDWLEGAIQVDPGSTFKSVSGEATGRMRKPHTFNEFTVEQGSGVNLRLDNNKVGAFSGVVLFGYDNFLNGSLSLDERTTKEKFFGHGAAAVQTDKKLDSAGKVILKSGSSAGVEIENSKLTGVSGTLMVSYEDWLEGTIALATTQKLENVSGPAQLVVVDKKTWNKVSLMPGSALRTNISAGKMSDFDGNATVQYDGTVEGSLTIDPGSTTDNISGEAAVSLIKSIKVTDKLKLVKGGNISGRFDKKGITELGGTVKLDYDSKFLGMIRAESGSSFESMTGEASLRTTAKVPMGGGLELQEGSGILVKFAGNTPTHYQGNIDITYDEWLRGVLNFQATDLQNVSGFGSLSVEQTQQLVGPLSINQGSYVKANFEKSALKDFEGMLDVSVDGWGSGRVVAHPGSTRKNLNGYGEIELGGPKELGSAVTLTSGKIGATVEKSSLKGIYGEAQATVNDYGEGWVRVYKSSTLEQFDGQAGLKLTNPISIGSFAELSGGEVLINFEKNALKSFGGFAEINVFGWGKGKVMIEAGSTMEYIKGSASLTLETPKNLAGGQLILTHGEVQATVDGQSLSEIGGKIGLELKDVARGEVSGTLNVQKEEFTGRGKVSQIKEWGVGPIKITDGVLEAYVEANELRTAYGSAKIDAGKIGKGAIKVNYIREGGKDIIYGQAELEFKPHDRIKGRIKAGLSKEGKISGEGRAWVTISKDPEITGEAAIILREDGDVVLQGKVNIPGPFSLFEPDPYKKDITLIDKGFMVYTPPIVKVNVGAGLGIEAGIKPLEISNICVSGEVNLMEPEYAGMSVTGHLASSAYCDLNAYVEGSVSVSAAVVAVEAGLRAALNLHLEAAISADPTITVNRNGLTFDMPVSAELSAALNLILSFFAKVRVGIDVGLFSIMKTVWRYSASPDPLQLARMAIGARGNVHAGPDGFSATMNPEYEPPDLTIEGLKRAIGL